MKYIFSPNDPTNEHWIDLDIFKSFMKCIILHFAALLFLNMYLNFFIQLFKDAE